MKNNSPKTISVKWIFIAMIFGALCWAATVYFIAKKIQNPDGIISVICIVVLVVFISVYLFVCDIHKSIEASDDDDIAN
jgi:fatty acid desaturase